VRRLFPGETLAYFLSGLAIGISLATLAFQALQPGGWGEWVGLIDHRPLR
jgi:hypothetical protein